jgi:DeoR/GlpR family transcriptional regulator of sugar metabolism
MLTRAAKVRIALADHGKFGKQCFAYVGPATDINTLVTDSGTDPRYIKGLRDMGVQVLIAEADTSASRARDQKKSSKKH